MDLLTVTVQLVNAGLQVYLAAVFYSSLSKPKFSLKILMPAEIIFTLFMAYGLIFFRGKVTLYLFTLLPTMLLTFMFKGSAVSKLLSFLSYNAMEIAAEMLAATFSSILHFAEFDAINTAYIVGMLMSKLLVFIIIATVRISKRGKNFGHYRSGGFKACMFPLASFLVMIIQYIILGDSISQYNDLSYLILVSYTILIISNMIVFDYIDSIYLHAVDKEKIAVANEIITQQTIQYNDLIKHNEDIMKIQHDNKNFNIGLISDLEEGKISSVIDSLKNANNAYLNKSNYYGNIVYSILDIKRQEAQDRNIDISFEDHNLNQIVIPSTDLAIIIGNALDNAIDECKRIPDTGKKQISMLVSQQNDTIVIIIKNPAADDVNISSLTSKKADSEHHGFGIISMKQVALKYNGEVVFECENGIFTVSIIMNNISPKSLCE